MGDDNGYLDSSLVQQRPRNKVWKSIAFLQEAEAKRLEDGGGGVEDAGADEESKEGLQHAMQEGLLTSHGLEFDKQWTRMLRVIKAQVCRCLVRFSCN